MPVSFETLFYTSFTAALRSVLCNIAFLIFLFIFVSFDYFYSGIVDRLSSNGNNQTRIGCRKCGYRKFFVLLIYKRRFDSKVYARLLEAPLESLRIQVNEFKLTTFWIIVALE